MVWLPHPRFRWARAWSESESKVGTAVVNGYCLAPYFLWFCHNFYGGLKKFGVVTVGPPRSPLTEQWQGNGDGGTFPQLEEARQPPHRPLRTSAFTPRCMVGVWYSMVGMVSVQWWAAVKPTHVAPLDTYLGNPIPSLSRP